MLKQSERSVLFVESILNAQKGRKAFDVPLYLSKSRSNVAYRLVGSPLYAGFWLFALVGSDMSLADFSRNVCSTLLVMIQLTITVGSEDMECGRAGLCPNPK